jgi:sugar O-acyltransferase (sialic acid O-acetyltransferase NeuD family)
MGEVQRVAIIGAGGHGREVADILRHRAEVAGGLRVAGFIDGNAKLHGQEIDGLPVLGDLSWLAEADRRVLKVVCALGNPATCKRLAAQVVALGFELASAVSPLAHISPAARLEPGVVVFPHVVVNTGARVASSVTLNLGVTVSHDSSVGPYSNINPGARLAGNVTVGEGCYVGMGANVIQGCKVGEWSVIGAGAVVIRDLPPHVTAVGVPARVIKNREVIERS